MVYPAEVESSPMRSEGRKEGSMWAEELKEIAQRLNALAEALAGPGQPGSTTGPWYLLAGTGGTT